MCTKPPNIILVMCDDLGYGDAGFNGNGVIRTPHLDRLCAAGTRLTRFQAGGPVCSPTRGTCLTGRHYLRYGIDHVGQGHLPEQEETLAPRLGSIGYRTGHFGKWHPGTFEHTRVPYGQHHIDHLPPQLDDRVVDRFSPPWARGYQRGVATENTVPLWDPSRGFDSHSFARTDEPYPTPYYIDGLPVREPVLGCDSAFIMDHALDFISDAAGAGEAFFTTIWFHAPHTPVEAGPAYLRLYRDFADELAHYFGCITAMDAQMGRLAAALQSLAIDQDTLIWFCSDKGDGRRHRQGAASPQSRQHRRPARAQTQPLQRWHHRAGFRPLARCRSGRQAVCRARQHPRPVADGLLLPRPRPA
ncbi:MAG: sulfatase-like hydrolase/transferase [Planctomycetota bacterium]